MKSESEEFSRAKFDEFLKESAIVPSVCWREVAPLDEPPDYYVTIDGTEYAVEVTALMEWVPIGATSLPLTAVRTSLDAFVDQVRKTAELGGFLNGTYLIGFQRPIEDFRHVRDQMRPALLDYIRRTQHLSRAPGEMVLKHRGLQQCRIQKVHNLRDSVVMGGPTGGKRGDEAAEQVCILLKERIGDKVHKLRGVPSPRILLLHDRYLFADSVMLRECIPRLPSLGHFHTVLVVGGVVGALVLYSQNPDWL